MSNFQEKDRDITVTLDIVKKIISNAGFDIIEEAIKHPVKDIWSILIKDSDSGFYTNGKGITKNAALASAYCEFMERMFSGYLFYDYALKDSVPRGEWLFSKDEVKVDRKSYKKELLNKELWEFYDPDKILSFEKLIDSNRCELDYIISLPLSNCSDNSTTLFPFELLKNLYASNGLAAGNSKIESLIQGTSEAIERGVKNFIISESLSLPNIHEGLIEKLNLSDMIEDIESTGLKLLLKDASLGGRFPVICALLIDRDQGKVLSSFGAHPILKVAIERTLTELLQGRDLETLSDFSDLTYNYDQVADEANLESHFINSTGALHMNIIRKSDEEMTLWQFEGSREDEFNFLINILNKEGYKLYYRAIEVGGMWVTQSIIPQLSEIYPIEDLEMDFKNQSGPVREMLKHGFQDKEHIKKCAHWFDQCYIPGSFKISESIGIKCDEDMYNFTVDELELLIYVIQKDLKKLHSLLNGQVVFETIESGRSALWKAVLAHLEGLDSEDLNNLFSSDINSNVMAILNGEIPLILYPLSGENYMKIESHKSIISAYNKYRIAMKALV